MSTIAVQEPPLGFNVFDPDCPARSMLDHLMTRWGVLTLKALTERTYRFSELRRRLGGVSEKMLAQTLRILEHDGLIRRTVYAQVPPRVDYALTPLGEQAATQVSALLDWVEASMPQILDARERHDAR